MGRETYRGVVLNPRQETDQLAKDLKVVSFIRNFRVELPQVGSFSQLGR